MKFKSKFINLFIFVISSLITIFTLEACLIFLKKKNSKQKNYISKYEFVKNYENKHKKNIFPASHPDFNITNNQFIPLGDISYTEIALCNESGDWSLFKSDRYGFNNNDELWDNKNKILLVGDSYVQGACVNSEEKISSQIMKKSNFKVISLANSKTGPISQLGFLLEYTELIKPKKIIWFYYEGNDFEDLKFEKKNLIAHNYLDNQIQNLKDKQYEVDYILKQKILNYQKNQTSELELFIKLSRVKNFLYTLYSIFRPYSEEDLNIYKKIVTKFKKTASLYNSELYLVYIPSFYRYSMPKIFKNKYNKEKILQIINSEDIKFLDLSDFFNFKNYKSFFPHGQFGHFNSKGYSLIADEIINNFLK